MTTPRRASYLARRKRRGLRRPAETAIRLISADSASARPDHVRRAIRAAGHTAPEEVEVLAIVEASDVRADRVLDDEWQALQYGPPGSPESALVLADRGVTFLRDVRLHPGTPPTAEGGGIRRRPILTATLEAIVDGLVGDDVDPDEAGGHDWRVPLTLSHAHPGRAPIARAAHMALLVAVHRGILLGDLNLPRGAVRRLIPTKRIHNAGVLFAVIPRWVPSAAVVVPAAELDDTDHDGLDVYLWPTRATRRRLRAEARARR